MMYKQKSSMTEIILLIFSDFTAGAVAHNQSLV